jgi:hypothetical protein
MRDIKRDRHERPLDRDPIVGGVWVDRKGGLHDRSLRRQMAAMVETICGHGGSRGEGDGEDE